MGFTASNLNHSLIGRDALDEFKFIRATEINPTVLEIVIFADS